MSAPGAPFFRSRWVDAPAGVEELDPTGLAPGFRAGGAHCGLKGGGKTDVGLLAVEAIDRQGRFDVGPRTVAVGGARPRFSTEH